MNQQIVSDANRRVSNAIVEAVNDAYYNDEVTSVGPWKISRRELYSGYEVQAMSGNERVCGPVQHLIEFLERKLGEARKTFVPTAVAGKIEGTGIGFMHGSLVRSADADQLRFSGHLTYAE